MRLFFVLFLRQSLHYTAQAMIDLLQPPKCWDFRHVPPYPASVRAFVYDNWITGTQNDFIYRRHVQWFPEETKALAESIAHSCGISPITVTYLKLPSTHRLEKNCMQLAFTTWSQPQDAEVYGRWRVMMSTIYFEVIKQKSENKISMSVCPPTHPSVCLSTYLSIQLTLLSIPWSATLRQNKSHKINVHT
jgi:hypothetical protein